MRSLPDAPHQEYISVSIVPVLLCQPRSIIVSPADCRVMVFPDITTDTNFWCANSFLPACAVVLLS
jgi:hypothetical protein